MLKRLELVGFKSFADKTTIDFAPGITAIVGPNGSGKSNIVDAVRWILGEQSAKSLRGGEMADVIFNGSTTRRSLGLAEVTMTFANDRRQLAVDADEVRVTRRVYRDGEGEYLINGQASRLRDIKDMFLGSGAGQGAYCIIEQGRVDALLQASHRDRRIIFEEAAGISRFKARKTETLRKLEHVEQNLARSRDLLEELAKQLRSVQLQAAKAQRYQEHSNRLRELRVGLGLQEYHDLTIQLQTETGALGRLRADLEHVSSQETEAEAELRRLDAALANYEEQVREQEAALSDVRQRIVGHETRRDFESSSREELELDLDRGRARSNELSARVAELTALVDQARIDWEAGELHAGECRTRTRRLEAALHAADAELDDLRKQIEADRADYLERMRQMARLQNDSIGLKARHDNLRTRSDGLRTRSAQAAEHLASIDQQLEELKQSETHVQEMLADARTELGRQEDERDEWRRRSEDARQRLADLRVQRSGLASRIELLEQLERSQEGLGTGVREVLDLVSRSRQRDPDSNDDIPDWSFVVGLVADCLTVPHELAPLIDVALGELSQYFLILDAERLDEALRRRNQPFASRVGFIPAPPIPPPAPAEGVYSGEEGRRADLLVSCESPLLAGVPARLLGTTRLVKDISAARSAAARPNASRLRFVTEQGELLTADGMVIAGAHQAEAGVLSRKSELRELRQQAAALDDSLAQVEREMAEYRQQAEAAEEPIYFLQQRIADLVEEASDLRARLSRHREKWSGLHDEVVLNRSEIDGLEQEIVELEAKLLDATRRVEQSETDAAEVSACTERNEREMREREAARIALEQELSQSRVELAQIEERQSGQRQRRADLDDELARREQELSAVAGHLSATVVRRRESQIAQLDAHAELAECLVRQETAERRLTALAFDRNRLRDDRRQASERLQAAAGERREKWDLAHGHEIRASELRMRLDGSCQRLREDYQIELAELYDRRNSAEEEPDAAKDELAEALERSAHAESTIAPPARLDPEATQKEIDDLRKKLARLGAVNLDALQELADLEKRVVEKQAQHDDLTKSQNDLLEIIHKINQDSKKLFADTFALIRGHFQELFRKLFGGGMADVFLENEDDVLESGIEINARPPGKELRSISLLSGGERTLTAVALLLAIFRSKPSPFCLLDEVDAALDEANNARLAGVLREFLDLSQFIVITHKKRTMAVADVLYGITMQEAGISKQISVRFEDWPDEESTPLEARAAG